MKKISLIIPHYNGVEGVKKLLSTVPTKKGLFEVLIVDDNSPLASFEELERLLKRTAEDLDVHLYKNGSSNKGAGAARNVGLDHATGEWILLADSDDYFSENLLEILEKELESTEEVIFFPPTSIDTETNQISDRHDQLVSYLTRYTETPSRSNEMLLRAYFSPPWSKLIKRELIIREGIRFDEIIVSNDVMFSTKVGILAKDFKIVDEIIYVVTRNSESLTSKPNREKFFIRVDTTVRRVEFMREQFGEEIKNITFNFYWMVRAARVQFGLRAALKTLLIFRKNDVPVIFPEKKLGKKLKVLFFTKKEKFLF
ncbi:MAG: glycosyltransferase [Streptococcaceae bacterium]|jgi:glycosyltransferase involved in cell wall biosynthesis|nr:glycosyltransferase [Streptococcaceae bacterium]